MVPAFCSWKPIKIHEYAAEEIGGILYGGVDIVER